MPSSITARDFPTFGAGAREPYAGALRDAERTLYLHDAQREFDGDHASLSRLDVDRFRAAADAADAVAISDVVGPVLDIGCGPGRMVRAAILGGHLALGIDVSPIAVEMATEQGLPVLCRSVFQELPAEGTWGTALLLDGNIGIGGNPQALLRRCSELVLADGEGRIVVEAHAEPGRDRSFEGVVIDDLSQQSLPFPWAEVGVDALRVHAARAGLVAMREWSHDSRVFAEFMVAEVAMVVNG